MSRSKRGETQAAIIAQAANGSRQFRISSYGSYAVVVEGRWSL